LQLKRPFFSLFQTSKKLLPCFLEEPSSGFGYPLDGVSSSQPWRFQTSNTPGILSSEPCSSSMIEDQVSLSSFRSCAFFQDLPALDRCFSGFLSSKKLCPCLLPQICFRGGADCSLEF
jgi:hypothetical protein